MCGVCWQNLINADISKTGPVLHTVWITQRIPLLVGWPKLLLGFSHHLHSKRTRFLLYVLKRNGASENTVFLYAVVFVSSIEVIHMHSTFFELVQCDLRISLYGSSPRAPCLQNLFTKRCSFCKGRGQWARRPTNQFVKLHENQTKWNIFTTK